MVEFKKLFLQFLSIVSKAVEPYLPGSMHTELEMASGKECANILLSEVKHPDHYFYLSDGVVIKSLCDLENIMAEMPQEVFETHVSKGKNDFAKWVKEIVGDNVLGAKLSELGTKDEMSKAVSIRVNFMKQRARIRS
ncbi:MAG: hypothetical protein Q7S21_04550 [archaeon]|nr:hypothetical protein [archaeon]